MADSDGQAWLKVHNHRVDQLIYFFYATAVLAAVAIVAPLKWPRFEKRAGDHHLVLAFATVGAGAYIAYAGGRIRHREFRNEPPPSVPADAEER